SVGRRGSWFVEENRALAHFYGYVYFRQVEDAAVKRGYFQKSLVLVSRLPYTHLFQSLLQIIAPEYFEKLEPCLEAVCNEIDQWQSPVPGLTLNLPVTGVVMQVRIPSKNDKPGGSPVKQAQKEVAPMMLSTIHELDLLKCFQSFLIHLQILWRLMLIGEPVVIMAPSPTVSSETVLALASSIAPLQYCCDYRPYFTIHDTEFKEYTTTTQAPPYVILGVTNPFFIKTFQSWPHIIHLGELKMSGDLPVKVKKLSELVCKNMFSQPVGIYTAHKMFLQKENAILRRHLLELTQSFIIPLRGLLMPLSVSFSQEEFMGTVEHAGPRLTSVHKGMRKFFRSPNFDGWYRLRHGDGPETRMSPPRVKEGVLENLEGYPQTIINSVP
uniref:DENN/MADD domain containing 6B n=1 Tax=Oncorhynchus kisutch TaxID=8019 RepID=A0A8C7M9F6_ONCKI